MKVYYFLTAVLLLFFNSQSSKAQSSDVIDDICGLIKTCDTKGLSKYYFASTVELGILTEEDVYSKVQAEQILKDFFNKHNPNSVKVVHRLVSNPDYKFAVVLINTDKGRFRTSFSMKNTGSKFLITEMRIEYNKE